MFSFTRVPRALFFVPVLIGIVFLSGCSSWGKKDPPPTVARFYIEARDGDLGLSVRMPVSGTAITMSPKAYFTEYDITSVDVGMSETSPYMLFNLTAEAARDLYRITAMNQGRRMILTVNGKPVGARMIDRAFSEGFVYMFVEVPEANLQELATNIAYTSADARRKLKD